MSRLVKAALFDVDGTLVDTNYLHVVTWWQAFSQAASLPALKAQAVKESLPLSFIGGDAVSGRVNTALANSGSIAAYVNQ